MENIPSGTSAVMALEWHQLELKYAHLRILDPQRQARLLASLADSEQQAPVVVVENAPAAFVLIDGYARVAALKTLGRDLVLAVKLAMSEAEALVFCHRTQNGARPNALEEGWLLFELIETHRLEQRRLAVMLSRSPSWISRRLALLEALPDSVQEQVRVGEVCAYSAMKYLAPLARANWEHCKKLVANLKGRRTSVREMERLYRAYKAGTPEERERLVEHPLLFLKVDAESKKPDTDVLPESAAEALVRELELAATATRRVRRRLKEEKRRGNDLSLNEAVRRACGETFSSFDALHEAWEELIGAGFRHTNGRADAQKAGAR
jgi:ParB/RepB/Spo0J family partition protein